MPTEKPAFDPNKPFVPVGTSAHEKPAFDTNKPYEPVEVKKDPTAYISSVYKQPVINKALKDPSVTEEEKRRAATDLLKGSQQSLEPIDEIERKNIQSTWGIPSPQREEDKKSLSYKATETIGNYIEQSAIAAGEGVERVKKGIQTAFGTPKTKTEPLKGVLNTLAGTAEAAFGVGNLVSPQLILFNTGIGAVKSIPEDVKASLMFPVPGKTTEEQAATFDKVIDLPFTSATVLAEKLGYNPEEGSTGQAVIDLVNLIVPVAAHRVALKGGETKIKDSQGLMESIDKIKNGKEAALELEDYTRLSNELQGITLEEIKGEAIKKGTPESMDIALKIDNLAPKPITKEDINKQYRKQSDDQSKEVYNAIQAGSSEALKDNLEYSLSLGEITPEQYEKAVFKIETYKKYAEQSKPLAMEMETERRLHDLTWSNENLQKQAETLRPEADAKTPGSITHIKLAEIENIIRENSKEMGELMGKEIISQQSAVSVKTQEKANAVVKKIETAVEEKNIPTVEENLFVADNFKKIQKEFPEMGDSEIFAEARRQYKELEAKGELPKKEEAKTVSATEEKIAEPAKEVVQELPKLKKEPKVEPIKEETIVKPKEEIKLDEETEKYVTDQIERLKADKEAQFDESLMPIYKEHFKNKYDEQKEINTRTGDQGVKQDNTIPEKGKVKRIVAGTPKAKRKLGEKATKVLKVEAATPYDRALQYFVGKGNLHPSAIKELYGKSKGEMDARIGLLNKTTGKTVSEIAHDLWEKRPQGEEHLTDQDYLNAVEQVINDHKSRSSMADELLRKSDVTHEMSERDKAYYDQLVENDKQFADEAIDIWDSLTDAEKEALAIEAEANVEKIESTKPEIDIQAERDALADKLLKGKIKGAGVHIDFGITKTVVNTAIEFAARHVRKGDKIGVAIEKAVKWVDEQVKGAKWQKKKFISHLQELLKTDILDAEGNLVKTPMSPLEISKSVEAYKNRESKLKEEVKDAGKSFNDFISESLAPVSTVLRDINPIFNKYVRTYQLNFQEAIKKHIASTKDYLDTKKVMRKKNINDYAEYNFALKNLDSPVSKDIIKKLNEKYGMEESYSKLKEVFDEIYDDSKAVGIDFGYKEEYFPRVVKDFEGLMDHIAKEHNADFNVIQELIQRKNAHTGKTMTVAEEATFVNDLLTRQKGTISLEGIGNYKLRTIDHLTPEMAEFYMDSDQALLHYITGTRESIARRKLFGKFADESGNIKDSGQAMRYEDSIGFHAMKLLGEGKITNEQFRKIQDVLTAYFNKGQQSKFMTALKTTAYLDVLANVKAAITNFADTGVAIYEAGLISGVASTARAIAGKSKIKMNEVLAEDVIHDFENKVSTHGVTDFMFTYSGFKHFDKLGKEAIINSVMSKLQKDANRMDKMKPSEKLKFKKRITEWIEDQHVDQVIKDLKEGKLTEQTLRLVYTRVLDLTPVAKSEMSEVYLRNPAGRYRFAMHSYTLKRFDMYRNDIFKKINSKDPKEKLEGIKNLIKMATALSLAQATTSTVQNLMSGKKVELDDLTYNTMLQLLGASPYLVSKFKREGPVAIATSQLVPAPISIPAQFTWDIYQDIFGKREGRSVRHIPFIGTTIWDRTHRK